MDEQPTKGPWSLNESGGEGWQNRSNHSEGQGIPPSLMALYEETIAFERIVGITIPTIFALVIFVGLVGNILVILIIVTNRQMQNSTNVLIINLALADLLFLTYCVPFTAADYALPVWVFSREWCKAMLYFQNVSAYSSVWTLVLMASDRFLAVVFPIPSMSLRTVKRTSIAVVSLWVLILSTNLPHLWSADVHTYVFVKERRSVCAFLKHATLQGNESEIQAYYFSFNAFGYVIPLSITLGLYAVMLKKLWYRAPVGVGKRVSEESMRSKKRVTILVLTVTGVFAFCWLPLNICFFIISSKYEQGRNPALTKGFFIFQVIAQVLAYANSCLNPILYAFLSENFRKGFKTLMFKCRHCQCRREFRHFGRVNTSQRLEVTTNRFDSKKSKETKQTAVPNDSPMVKRVTHVDKDYLNNQGNELEEREALVTQAKSTTTAAKPEAVLPSNKVSTTV